MKCSVIASVVMSVLVNFAASSSLHFDKIKGNVRFELAQNSTIDVLVSLKAGTASVLHKIRSIDEDSTVYDSIHRQSHIEKVVSTLKQNADESQKNVFQFLTNFRKSTPYKVQSFWITNQLFIEGADAELITKLALMEDIESIGLNEIFPLDPPITPSSTTLAEDPWGIRNINVPQAWALPNGNKGEGTIIATIDTGVRRTHESLRNNFLGTYGWYDPAGRTTTPYDNQGHGTHVTGTIVGGSGIGVAPNAKWMACKGCRDSSCASTDLISCAQFVACPNFTAGPDSSPDCSKAPHIVSNSWGGSSGGSTTYNRVIDAWHAVGIIPVFSNGNEGENLCNTAGSPGDSARVIGVGSTTSDNGLSVFSSRGPSHFGTIKPDTSAPGTAILSASHTSDGEYVMKSGTSMACPHVAGVIALMKSSVPYLNYDLTKGYLFSNADRDFRFTGGICGGLNDSTFPNNHFGYGKVNALTTMEKLLIDRPFITTTTARTTASTTQRNANNNLRSCSEVVLLLLSAYCLI